MTISEALLDRIGKVKGKGFTLAAGGRETMGMARGWAPRILPNGKMRYFTFPCARSAV
jgi:hypothetical protein